MDFIHVNDMEFYGYHGVFPEETKLGQRFRLTVSLAVDLQKAGETDALEHTVHYGEVYEACRSIVEGEKISGGCSRKYCQPYSFGISIGARHPCPAHQAGSADSWPL